jgi:hypothetical protein
MTTFQARESVTVTRTFDQYGEVPSDPVYLCLPCYVSRAWVAPQLVSVDWMQTCRVCGAKGFDWLARVSLRWLAALEEGDG